MYCRRLSWRSGPHLVLPSQSSGTVRLPCTPVILRAPAPDEYCWVRHPDVEGFTLFIRDNVFLGGDLLDTHARVGLPPGDYRILVVSDNRIFETTTRIALGGTLDLGGFRDVTH